ncbi:MAG: hypothetical protein LBE91_02230 [Tannerella sp.]|jgi:hypothetical protein|nr:hypothetical protein [Tannerella sp.]
MKKVRKGIVKLFMAILAVVTFNACEDQSGNDIPSIKLGKVTEFARDDYRTHILYGDMYGRISEYAFQVGEKIIDKSNVVYTSSGMACRIDTITYDLQLSIARGGARISELRAYIGRAIYYYVEYQYDELGRLHLAKLERPADNEGKGSALWISYTYTENNIEINEGGYIYNIPLSETEKNSEYVCNVFMFASPSLTSTYIINPELYFLNIYGVQVDKLPAGETVRRMGDTDDRLASVGKYNYKY